MLLPTCNENCRESGLLNRAIRTKNDSERIAFWGDWLRNRCTTEWAVHFRVGVDTTEHLDRVILTLLLQTHTHV